MSAELEFEIEDEESQEEQLASDEKEISELVVYGTDWTTATILDQMKRGNIQLNPRFQRRDAWNIGRKSRFIESLMLGLPVPPIVLASSLEEKGKYIVLDGKQRLLTILQFYGCSDIAKNNLFKFKELELKPVLNSMNYQDISSHLIERSILDSLDNQTIRTSIIRNWKSQSLLHKIFLRLNTESTPLAPQELRQALNAGEFTGFVDDEAISRDSLKLIYPQTPDYRMRDTELLLRYLSYYFFIEDYSGNLKSFLDKTCKVMNESWDVRQNDVKIAIESFDQSVAALVEIFGKKYFSHVWLDDKNQYQVRFNRAVFDVLMFYFDNDSVREKARENAREVEQEFKRLCKDSPEFVRSVERTSKNLNETQTRFRLWGESLSKVLGVSLRVPVLNENKRFELRKVG
jgi:Protein of unknown function DUF262